MSRFRGRVDAERRPGRYPSGREQVVVVQQGEGGENMSSGAAGVAPSRSAKKLTWAVSSFAIRVQKLCVAEKTILLTVV